MTATLISDALGGIDSRFVEEALDEPAARSVPLWRRYIAAAACLLVAVTAFWQLFPTQPVRLSDPAVTVTHMPQEAHPLYPFRKISNSADISASLSMTKLEEFDKLIEYSLTRTEDDVMSGAITQIDTLELDFDGTHCYVLLAYIQLRHVYRGEFESGDEVKVLLTNTLYAETDENPLIFCHFEVGKGALLTAKRTDTSQTLLVNGLSLVLSDVADYVYDDGHISFIGEMDT